MSSVPAFVSCAPGLEPMLLREIQEMDPTLSAKLVTGGVEFSASLEQVYQANLHLGLAIRVLVRVGTFKVSRFDKLVKKVSSLPLREWLPPVTALDVRAKCSKSKLYHSQAVAERVAEGLASQITIDATSKRVSRVQVRIVRDLCTISIDTSGEALHRRGYRLATGKAPLREDLSRALLIASGWKPGMSLIDPMSGSGTLVIEAALMSAGRAPGALREFAFQQATGFDNRLFDQLCSGLSAGEAPAIPTLLGSDRDPQAKSFSAANAQRAGVENWVNFEQAELSRSPHFELKHSSQGAIVTNPPYGKRTGRASTLKALYQSLGHSTQRVPDSWRFGLVATSPKLAYATEVPLKSELRTRNGSLSVVYFSKR